MYETTNETAQNADPESGSRPGSSGDAEGWIDQIANWYEHEFLGGQARIGLSDDTDPMILQRHFVTKH
jgi:hypothetical protein